MRIKFWLGYAFVTMCNVVGLLSLVVTASLFLVAGVAILVEKEALVLVLCAILAITFCFGILYIYDEADSYVQAEKMKRKVNKSDKSDKPDKSDKSDKSVEQTKKGKTK